MFLFQLQAENRYFILKLHIACSSLWLSTLLCSTLRVCLRHKSIGREPVGASLRKIGDRCGKLSWSEFTLNSFRMPKGHSGLNAIDSCDWKIATWYEQVLFQTAVECHGQRLQPATNERNTFPDSLPQEYFFGVTQKICKLLLNSRANSVKEHNLLASLGLLPFTGWERLNNRYQLSVISLKKNSAIGAILDSEARNKEFSFPTPSGYAQSVP
jgi:hypothetical protein